MKIDGNSKERRAFELTQLGKTTEGSFLKYQSPCPNGCGERDKKAE